MIAVIDCCGANLTSVLFALERLGARAELTTDKKKIQSATHVILPGVGTAKHAMHQIENYQLADTIRNLTQPVLGICLGMQILFESSAEGNADCLGILKGEAKAFPQLENLTIPHMGWNSLKNLQDSKLLKNIPQDSYFYFVHSYAVPIGDYTVAACEYGVEFSAIVSHKNFHAMQFHPERSGKIGQLLLQNFLELST